MKITLRAIVLCKIAFIMCLTGCSKEKPIKDVSAATTTSAAKETSDVTVVPVTTATPVIAETGIISKNKLGINIEGLTDWSRGHMFVDAMKTARVWGQADEPWEPIKKVDNLGWPLQDAGVIVMTEADEHYQINGTYKLIFEGSATVGSVACDFTVTNQITKNGVTTADINIPKEQNQLMISFTDTQNGIKNVKLLRPGYTESQTFTDEFLKAIEPFGTIRFMDFLSTNQQEHLNGNMYEYDINPIEWKDRKLPGHASQASEIGRTRGGAYEYIIELANLTGKDIWVNCPYNATSEYYQKLAQMLDMKLNSNVHVYLELSNEVWNWSFVQASLNLYFAEHGGTNSYITQYARKVTEMATETRKAVGSSKMNDRFRVVLAWQFGWDPPDYQPKEMLDFIAQNYETPNQLIYGLAVAPYMQESLPSQSTSKDIVFKHFLKSSEEMAVNRRVMVEFTKKIGLKGGLMAYEGGVHPQGQEDLNLDLRMEANRDPMLTQILVKDLEDHWYNLGGGLFCYYSLTSSYSKYGCWGLTENIFKLDTPKYKAILELANKER